MERSILPLILWTFLCISADAQDSTKNAGSFDFLDDRLRSVASLSPSEKERVTKGEDPPTFYRKNGEQLIHREMKALIYERTPIIRSFVDRSLKIQAGVIVGFEEKPGTNPDGRTDSIEGDRDIPREFKFSLLNGNSYAFSQNEERDSILVLNFWFTACTPCKREIPELNQLVENFEGRPVRFIALSHEKASKITSFLKDRDFAYQQGVDGGKTIEAFGVHSFPAHIVVDRKGQVRSFQTGYNSERVDRLQGVIESLLKDE